MVHGADSEAEEQDIGYSDGWDEDVTLSLVNDYVTSATDTILLVHHSEWLVPNISEFPLIKLHQSYE
jgi:hypothetical protein